MLQLLAHTARDASASAAADALHAATRQAVQCLVAEGTHEAAPQLLQSLLGFAHQAPLDDDALLASALHVAATLLQADEACRATAISTDATLQHVLQLCARPLSERCMRGALKVLHAVVCAARDDQCTALCQRVLEAGMQVHMVLVRQHTVPPTEALSVQLEPSSAHSTQALHTLHVALEGCSTSEPQATLEGAAMQALLQQVMRALEWAPHTAHTVPVDGADASARAALSLFASLLERQCTAALVALLDMSDAPHGNGLAQVLLALADACSRDPTAAALQGVLPWPCPTAAPAESGWAAAPIVARRRYWDACVRLCQEALVLLRALLTHSSTGLAALDDLLATSEAARHALVTVTRLQSWEGGGAALPLAAWVLRADSVERNPLLQGRHASVEVVAALATSLHRRVLLSMEGASMEAG